ncbi:MAG: hypothetical protein C4297_13455 [Gemmataceae bacterium]
MWIADAAENEYYKARAESHGFIYVSTFRISEEGGSNLLTMTHDSKPQGFMAQLLTILLSFVLEGAMKKVILQDLNDIKPAVEQHRAEQSA